MEKYFKGDTPLEWMNIYKEIKYEMTKQYGDGESLTPELFSWEEEMNGTGICFENPTLNCSLYLVGDPESGLSGYNGGEVVIALLKKSVID